MSSETKIALGLLTFHLMVYVANGACLEHGDPIPSAFTARNIALYSEPYLDRLVRSPDDVARYSLVRSEAGHIFSGFGLGVPLAAAPAFFVADAAGVRWNIHTTHLVGKLAAALVTAVSVALVYLTLARFVSRRVAMLLSTAYGLGTMAWSTLSQGLWQQSVAAAALIAALWLLTKATERGPAMCAVGCALAFAVLCRPTHLISLLVVGVFVARRSFRSLAWFTLGAAPVLALLAVWNNVAYGGPFTAGQEILAATIAPIKTGDTAMWRSPLAGAAGLLFSPSRGLLFFCPFLLAAVPAAFSIPSVEDRAYKELLQIALCIAAAIFFVSSCYFDWWGGWSYGPRYVADTAVLWIVLLSPIVIRFGIVARGLFAAAITWSVVVQGIGVFCSDFAEWNCGTPQHPHQDIDTHHERLWALGDSQIFYHLKNMKPRRGLFGETPQGRSKSPGC